LQCEWNKEISKKFIFVIDLTIYIAFQPFEGDDRFFEQIKKAIFSNNINKLAGILGVFKKRIFFKKSILQIERNIDQSINEFENKLDIFNNNLDILSIKRLRNEDLLSDLSNRINLATYRNKVSTPKIGNIFLNTLLTTDSIFRVNNGSLKFVGSLCSKLLSVISIKGYPGIVNSDDIEKILMVNGSFSLVQNYRFLNNANAKEIIMSMEQFYRSQIKTPIVQLIEKISGVESTKIDNGQLILADDAQEALIDLTVNEINYGYHSMTLLISEDDENSLILTRNSLVEILTNSGYGLIQEVIYPVGAFLSTLPGSTDINIRSKLISSRNLSDLIITRSISNSKGENKYLTSKRKLYSPYLCAFNTKSGVPFKFNFHVGDVGHFMIIGPTGGGKSTFVNLMIIMWQKYSPCRVIVIDKDNSCYTTIKSLGGSYIDFKSRDIKLCKMNPLRWIEDDHREFQFTSWLICLIEAFNDSNITSSQVSSLKKAISYLKNNENSSVTLTNFHFMLQGIDHELSLRLLPWLKNPNKDLNSIDSIFDNEEDEFISELRSDKSGIIGIDLGNILSNEKITEPLIQYLLISIDELIDGHTPTMIYLEESWYLLENIKFRSVFEEWIKTMRKKQAIVGLSTQSVSDILKSGISSSLNDNIRTRIFLANFHAQSSYSIYSGLLGVSDKDINRIKTMRRQINYLIWQDGQVRLIETNFNKNILSFINSDKTDIDLINKYFDEFGNFKFKSYIEFI
jgi:type IV secretion system protein VirB4